MEQLPKIVGQRMQAATKAEVHPDANLLAAFVEQSLGERERIPLLEHLANCADCREVVSLSLPQLEEERAVAAGAAVASSPTQDRSSWFRRPIVGWAAAAACLVIVGTVALMHRTSYQQRPLTVVSKTDSVDTLAEPSVPTPQAESQSQTAAKLESPALPTEEKAARADFATSTRVAKQRMRDELARNQPTAPPIFMARTEAGTVAGKKSAITVDGVAPVSSNLSKDVKAKEMDQGAAEQVSVAQAAPPPPGSTVEVSVQPSHQQELKPQAASGGSVARVMQPNAVTLGALSTQKAAGANMAANEMRLRTASNLVTPRWTLSSDGTMLMRSYDAGRSWQTVAVAGNVVFRSLAALGSEVWAGGVGGTLYHSSDAGQHWAQVKPTANGKLLTSDILHVEFTDAQHGKLSTASGETWTTDDGGQNWQTK